MNRRLGPREWIHRALRILRDTRPGEELRGVSMGLGYVVDPARRRRGYGVAALRTVVDRLETADVEHFYCGIDFPRAIRNLAGGGSARGNDVQPTRFE